MPLGPRLKSLSVYLRLTAAGHCAAGGGACVSSSSHRHELDVLNLFLFVSNPEYML